jgi:hypothetical protein
MNMRHSIAAFRGWRLAGWRGSKESGNWSERARACNCNLEEHKRDERSKSKGETKTKNRKERPRPRPPARPAKSILLSTHRCILPPSIRRSMLALRLAGKQEQAHAT